MKILSDHFSLYTLPYRVTTLHVEALEFDVFKEEIKDAAIYTVEPNVLRVVEALTGKEAKPNSHPFILTAKDVLYICDVRTSISHKDEGLIRVAYKNHQINFWKIFLKEC